MKKEQIIYILIGVIITLIIGGGVVFWSLSKSDNDNINSNENTNVFQNINNANITLENENTNNNSNKVADKETTPDETVETTTEVITNTITTPTSTTTVTTSGMSTSEINSLFQTHYGRSATQDELNYWSVSREKSDLEWSLIAYPESNNNSSTPEPTPTPTNTNTSTPEPTPTVDPAMKIELCKSEAALAKLNAEISCTDLALEEYENSEGLAIYLSNLDVLQQRIDDCAYDPDALAPMEIINARKACHNEAVALYNDEYDELLAYKQAYLDLVPSCTDTVYQNTYNICLNS